MQGIKWMHHAPKKEGTFLEKHLRKKQGAGRTNASGAPANIFFAYAELEVDWCSGLFSTFHM